MKFSAIPIIFSSLFLSSSAVPISQASDSVSKPFSLLTIHSGSQFQYAEIKKVASSPEFFRVGGSEGVSLNYTLDATTGKLLDSDNEYIRVFNDGSVGEADAGQEASTGWSINDDNHLAYNSNDWLNACPFEGGAYYVLTAGDCGPGSEGVGVALRVEYST